jgi:putative peptidoglycan lipid II flippase
LAVIDLVVSALAALALYSPFGVGGIVAGTGIGTTAAVVAQAFILRREFNGLELRRLWSTGVRITVAAAALAGVGWVVWDLLDHALGRGLFDQIVSLGVGLAAGLVVYLATARALRIAELEQMTRLLRRR